MKMFTGSIWILYKSFFDAVPGQKGLLAIGLLLMALGYFQSDPNLVGLLTTAGSAFLAGFTLIFAGPHFRQLASFRKHRLLPSFRKHLIVSYLMALVSLSIFLLISAMLLEKQPVIQRIKSEDISTGILWLSIFGVLLITSFLGFLPRHLRYPVWLLIIICVANIQQFSVIPIKQLLLSVICISLVSLCCFIYYLGISKKPIFYTKKAVTLSKYLPGLNGSFQERGVTATGSILLGMSDGNNSRFFRAAFTAFLWPIVLACSILLTGRYSAEQLFKTPLFIFLGLMTGVMIQIHFSFTVSARRRFIWLRVGGSRQQLNQIAQKVLARERWAMLFCYGLWCAPVLIIFPQVAAWILGVSTLLWGMMLFIEKIILTLKGQLTQRAEFYMLLIFIGLVVSPIALANTHQQPWILWLGVAVILSLYSALTLMLKIK